MTITATDTTAKIKYDQCVYDTWDYGHSIGWEKQHGTVTLKEARLEGYSFAFKVVIDMKYSYQETSNGELSTGEAKQKGSMTIGEGTYKTAIAGLKLDLEAKGKDGEESWSGQFWIRDFDSTSSFSGSEEVRRYSGRVGAKSSDGSLNGSVDISTDEYLKINSSYGYGTEFPQGRL